MKYRGDRRGVMCRKCGRKVTLVRCPNCNGRGGGLMSQCRRCRNSGYVCQNQRGSEGHQP